MGWRDRGERREEITWKQSVRGGCCEYVYVPGCALCCQRCTEVVGEEEEEEEFIDMYL